MSKEYIISSPKPRYKAPDINLANYVIKCLQDLNKETICLIDAFDDSRLTIGELISKANSIGKALIKRGINKTDIVLTFADNSIEHAIVSFASVFLGITLYPISPIANVYEIQTLFETLNTINIFVSKRKAEVIEKVLDNLKSNEKFIAKTVVVLNGVYNNYLTFGELLKEGENQSLEKLPYFDVYPKDICILLQSSGTTGVPKSVIISHKAFVANISSIIRDKNVILNPLIFASLTPIGSISGATFLFSYVCFEATLVIYSQPNEELILKSIPKYKINSTFISPVFGNRLISRNCFEKYDLSTLRQISSGGAAFSPDVARQFIKRNIIYKEGYAMTEYCAITDCLNIEDSEYIPGSLQKPTQNTEIKIIDLNTKESVGPDMKGEILVRGPKMFSGYLNNPVATSEAFDSDGWLHTGDIGHYDEENRLFITDRLKELIKYNTKQVSPTEIELFLSTHKAVTEVAVVGVRHQTQNQWPRAYVKTAPDVTVTAQELQKYVSDSLGESKQLRAGVVFVEHIPRTAIGKVDRKYFKQLVFQELILSDE